MNTAWVIAIVVTALLIGASVYGIIRYNRWLDKKSREGCWGQFVVMISIGIVCYSVIIGLVIIAYVLSYFLGGMAIMSLFMIPVKFNFSWVQIALYGGALGILFMIGRYVRDRMLAKWESPANSDLRELRN
jgi:hypothetical protein